jgi:hypothetical protein
MIGYNKTKLEAITSHFMKYFDGMSSKRTKVSASFYKILMDFDDTRGIHKNVFFVLFVLALLDKRNVYTYSDKGLTDIYSSAFIPEINRALYSQDKIRLRIQKPSEIPSWILYSLEAIGNGNLEVVLVIMAINFKSDIENMFPEKEEMEYIMQETSIFTKESFITFKEIADAHRDYTIKQV